MHTLPPHHEISTLFQCTKTNNLSGLDPTGAKKFYATKVDVTELENTAPRASVQTKCAMRLRGIKLQLVGLATALGLDVARSISMSYPLP